MSGSHTQVQTFRATCGCIVELSFKTAMLMGLYGARHVPITIKKSCRQHSQGRKRLCCYTLVGTNHLRTCERKYPPAHLETHQCEEWQFTPPEDLPEKHPRGLRHCRACGKLRAIVHPMDLERGRHRSRPGMAPYVANKYSVLEIRRRRF